MPFNVPWTPRVTLSRETLVTGSAKIYRLLGRARGSFSAIRDRHGLVFNEVYAISWARHQPLGSQTVGSVRKRELHKAFQEFQAI